MRITNPKLATLDPAWRRYRGLSVLFDNPGSRPGPGITALEDVPVGDGQRQTLYDVLAGVVGDADPERMRDGYGFCPLPRYSYHVTVCDGPNEHAIAGATSPDGAVAAALIAELPDSLDRATAQLRWLCRSPLLGAVAANAVTLAVSDVVIWGHVLAARLVPVDTQAQGALDRIAQARAALVDQLESRLGLQTQAWRPHVSLGYFANRRSAKAATATLPQWRRALAAQRTPPIRFASAAVYGFTDMASFYRLGVRGAVSNGPGNGR